MIMSYCNIKRLECVAFIILDKIPIKHGVKSSLYHEESVKCVCFIFNHIKLSLSQAVKCNS